MMMMVTIVSLRVGGQDGLPVTSDDRVIANTRSGQLKITSLTQYDVGKYLCIASNTVGRMTAERIINVHSRHIIQFSLHVCL